MRFILVLHLSCRFELLQGPMRFVLMSQAGSIEILFVFADQNLYVNKSLNSIR